jgi:phosphopantetheine adenylyltransferase
MIAIIFELKGTKESQDFYSEAKLILGNNKFTEINENTFIASSGNVSSIAEKLKKSGVYQKGCKSLYYTSSLIKK